MNRTWEELFGASSDEEQKNTDHTNDPSSLIQDVPKFNDKIKESIGQHLFEHIKQSHQMIQSKNLNSYEKTQLKQSLEFFLKIVRLDLKHLVDTQVMLITVGVLLSGLDSQQKCKFEKILNTLDKLILNQVKQMKKLHYPVSFKTRITIEKSNIENLCLELIKDLNNGMLQEVVTLLLGFHCTFSERQATMIFEAAKQADTSNLQDLLSFLKLRLFSKPMNNPETINYGSLTDNHFLQDPSSFPDPNRNILFMHSTLEEIITTYNYLWESKVKNQFHDLIINPLNSFIDMPLTHHSASSNHLPYLRLNNLKNRLN